MTTGFQSAIMLFVVRAIQARLRAKIQARSEQRALILCGLHLGVAQLGSVLEWGSRGREFKSLHPDQQKSPKNKGFRAFFFA